MDERDPRSHKETWPCQGVHLKETFHNNRYGQWSECARCALRTSYTPAIGAPGQSTRTDLAMNVTEAIHKLRAEGWEAEEMKASVMKAAIEVVAKEKKIHSKPKKTGGYVNKEKESRKMESDQDQEKKAKANQIPPEGVTIPDSDEGEDFHLVTDKKEEPRA